ncbi:prenylcysteine oxidase 1-like isoform X2 [Planococcus citri]
MGDTVKIDVYEADKIGGRLATRDYKGGTYEVGGCVIHSRNKYMSYFRDKFELEETKERSEYAIGIYDQNGIEFISSEWKLVTFAKMLLRYGYSLFKLDSFIETMLDEFDRIYELQLQGKSFETVEDLLGSASANFLKYLNIDSEDGFSKIAGINEVTINDLVRGSLRVNYGQTTNVHLFVGSVSVAGMTGKLWSIEGGNKKIPELLIKNNSVNFIHNKVIRIIFNDENETYTVESINQKNGDELSNTYKFVVLAHPITDDCKDPIEFINFPNPIKVKGKYHRTVSTILAGNLNGSYFGIKEKKVPDLVINNDVSKVINSVGRINPVSTSKLSESNVWKIFSKRPLTETELDDLFSERSPCSVVDWLAYPQYTDLGVSSKFILHPGLYYINAIEWAASAMEMSVIGAKNVALLISKELSIQVENEKNFMKNERNEL